MSEAVKLDQGKPRYELIPAYPQEQYALVLTFGARKYKDHNWMKGMAWSRYLGAMERHLYAIKAGEDIDPESGLLHAAHIMCCAAFLAQYYKTYPQGDDRPSTLEPKTGSGTEFALDTVNKT